ncbi:hypothetical protein AcV5_003962 [Taiwanofungus camphoratus]|nr:hypothetical protein AcV5_003962 [Antrodia cinnamomea]KAI0960795.1 hypothetical protein AcV7_000082 [Antrodia cinnamomea]
MAKRKSLAYDPDSDPDDASDRSLNVDFDFFDPAPDVDYLALKRLAVQLFQADADRLHPSAFADLVLSQPLVGTTVKCDGRASDPYAVLTVLNMHVHQNHPSIKALIEYALAKSAPDPAFHAALHSLLCTPAFTQSQNHTPNHVGLLFSERLINIPVQVVPHMYRMLADEIQWALDDNEPYAFSHLLLFSRTYRPTPDDDAYADPAAPPPKRQKHTPAPLAPANDGVYPFHPEDAVIQTLATHTLDYLLPRAADGPGPSLGGRMTLLPFARLPDLVARLAAAFPPPS